MLSSNSLTAIDAALEQYAYLGAPVGELLEKLRTRRTLVACAPRGQHYSTLVDTAERMADLELSTRGLREKVLWEEEMASSVEARVSAETAAAHQVEEEILVLRRQLRQRASIAQMNGATLAASITPANAKTRGHKRRCAVCHKQVQADQWRTHSKECLRTCLDHVMQACGQ